MVRHLDDSAQVKGYEQADATVIKDAARLATDDAPRKVMNATGALDGKTALVTSGCGALGGRWRP